MKIIQVDITLLQTTYPNAWKDFEEFLEELNESNHFVSPFLFSNFPFEFQLGVFFRYFNENNIAFDCCSVELELIPTLIIESFKAYNHSLTHFS